MLGTRTRSRAAAAAQMAAVWTEVRTLAVVDQFAESRGKINLGLLHALARTHALLYRNSDCLVFVQVLDARP